MQLLEILASFTQPIDIGTNPQAMLWLIPLALAGVIVYKTMKLPKITPIKFLREVLSLFLFLMGLLIIISLVLLIVTVMVT